MKHLLALGWLVLIPAQAGQEQIMTTAPNVRLRATPDTSGEILREVRLASVHNVEARVPGGWVKVKFGYLREELTMPFTSADRLAVLDRIVRAQLDTQGLGFGAWNQLLAVTGSHMATGGDREVQARFALYELKALRGAANAAGGLFRTRFAFSLGATSDVFVNHEPAGRWILRREHILTVHDGFKDTAAADDILWFATENGLPGECEGEPACHAFVANTLYGDYLRRYPSGRHVDNAMAAIDMWLHYGTQDPAQAGGYREGCAEIRKDVDAMTDAVARAVSPRKEAFRQTAEKFTAICR